MTFSRKIPADCLLADYATPDDYVDVFSASLANRPDLQDCDIRQLGDHFATIDMPWAQSLLKLRDRLARPFGLKTTHDLQQGGRSVATLGKEVGDRINFFQIFKIDPDEIRLGEDDWHQDFRLSVFRERGASPRVSLVTVCKRHNLFGRAYLASILPFHKKLVQETIQSALRRPLADA